MYICQASHYDHGVATRSRNPRGEGARLREQLLRAASEVLDEVGDADRVSVRAIARRAGVSPTALYLHFPDRDAAVAAAVDAGFVAFNAALRDAAGTGRLPDRELSDAGLVLVGGTLLVTPGFLTDIVGFFLVLPFTRPIARRLLAWVIARRFVALTQSTPQRGPADPRVIPGEVYRSDPDP